MNLAVDPSDPALQPVIVLFRHDLRLADNIALTMAAQSGHPVLPVFILDDESDGIRPIGGARRWWLHHSLRSLGSDLARLWAPLTLRKGKQNRIVAELAAQTGARTVYWNRRYDPPAAQVDQQLSEELDRSGVASRSFEGHLLHDPFRVRTSTGQPYKVFTPFYRAFEMEQTREVADAPDRLNGYSGMVASDQLDDWALLPGNPDWATGFDPVWTPGERGAHERLHAFLDGAISGYATKRDFAGHDTTSRLSPHLAHGEITPAQIHQALNRPGNGNAGDREKFRKEVAWREFSYHLLANFPELPRENFNDRFDRFSWQNDERLVRAWQTGLTGYPLVDAGMRQLWRTGWMHNRVRMVTASFLTKHLLTDWRIGEAWFWDTLVDADPASNAASWQWVAGSGADAAPYFRVFNPTLQGQKFDPDGRYVKAFVPELRPVPSKEIYSLREGQAGYPQPIVRHDQARRRALAAYDHSG